VKNENRNGALVHWCTAPTNFSFKQGV